MPLISHARWLARSWRTGLIDVLPGGGAPAAGIVAWGLALRKRWTGDWLRTHKAIDGGRRFDLSSGAVLEWTHAAASEAAGLPIEGGLLKERIILDRQPAANRFEFELEVPAGTTLALQPALTPQEAERGHVRPAAIVGSYALFGPQGEKIAHVLRPFAQDADGRREWLELSADALSPTLVRLAITAPWALLASARYPLVIDPTMGYTSVGGSYYSDASQAVYGDGPWSPAASGTTASIAWYVQSLFSGGRQTFGLYLGDGSGGAPSTRVVDTAGGAPVEYWPGGWLTLNCDSAASISSASAYFIGTHTGPNGGGSHRFWYDALTDHKLYYKQSQSYADGSMPSPFPSSPSLQEGYVRSCYLTYTETAAKKTPWHLFLCGRGS